MLDLPGQLHEKGHGLPDPACRTHNGDLRRADAGRAQVQFSRRASMAALANSNEEGTLLTDYIGRPKIK